MKMKYPKPHSMGDNGDNRKYKKWLKSRHVKDMLGISESTLKRYREKGIIQTHQPYEGANFLYDPDGVAKFNRPD